MTSPYLIYILIGLTYLDYKVENFIAYIDSGSSLCLAKEDCFPKQYHENLPGVQRKDISNDIILLQRGIKTQRLLLINILSNYPLFFFMSRNVILY